jgi:hypothetical protein
LLSSAHRATIKIFNPVGRMQTFKRALFNTFTWIRFDSRVYFVAWLTKVNGQSSTVVYRLFAAILTLILEELPSMLATFLLRGLLRI